MARANEGEVVWVAVDVWHPLAVVVVRMAVAGGATSWSARSEAVEEEEEALLLEVVREPVCWSVWCFEEEVEKASAPRRPTPAQRRPTPFAVVVKVETVAGCGSLEAPSFGVDSCPSLPQSLSGRAAGDQLFSTRFETCVASAEHLVNERPRNAKQDVV